jgi:hypothetical protein
MMHPADNGLIVICGPSDAVTAYIADHGLDPVKVIRPGDPTYSHHLTIDQVVILDGWNPDPSDVQWFWVDVAQRMFAPADSRGLYELAQTVPGLMPEAMK